MPEKPLLSVILPVYNSEKTLKKCLDSIIAQTFNNFELIIVNDESTDKSREISDEYARNDDRIKVILKENAGVSAARNDGIMPAKGEYIAFIDSDDYIYPQMYERMLNIINTYNTDFVCCGYLHKGKNYSLPDNILNGSQAEIIYNLKNAQLFDYIWNKLYKKSIIKDNNVLFPSGYSFGEDFIFNLKYFSCINNGYCISDILYFYSYNEESVSKKRPFFEHSLFRFNNSSSLICGLTDNDNHFKNRILAKDFTFSIFLIRNLYIPFCLPNQKRLELLLYIRSFYKNNNAVKDFMGLHYLIFYKALLFLPIKLLDFLLNFFFHILYKIRGYS
jgi:glycosyltransferase involved in cell wall biosynthesis